MVRRRGKLVMLSGRIIRDEDDAVLAESTASFMVIGDDGTIFDIPAESSRMAMAVISAGPMLFVFPFFQKYFVRGLKVGSIKG